MQKRILVLTTSALILACGAVAASAQQPPMMQQQQTPQQEQERQLHHPDWFRGMGMMGRRGMMGGTPKPTSQAIQAAAEGRSAAWQS